MRRREPRAPAAHPALVVGGRHSQALPLEGLPLHLASWQRLASDGGLRELQDALEALFGVSGARRHVGIGHPSRAPRSLLSRRGSTACCRRATWSGPAAARRGSRFSFPADLDLLDLPAEGGNGLLPESGSRVGFDELAQGSGLESAELSERLWDEVWRGAASNTGFAAVRSAALGRFKATDDPPPAGSRCRPAPGSFVAAPVRALARLAPLFGRLVSPGSPTQASEPLDALDLEELNKDRVRVLLDRYGVLFRELLSRELPAFQWSRVFRSLRMMELSGEVLAGQFFEGVHGLQFASQAAYRRLRAGLPKTRSTG